MAKIKLILCDNIDSESSSFDVTINSEVNSRKLFNMMVEVLLNSELVG